MFQRTLAVMAFTLLIGLVPVLAQDTEPSPTPYSPVFPISVESCGETITFEAAPERALAFDTNLTEIMLALELEDRMAGYWLSGDGIAEVFQDQIEAIPLISEETWPPPGLETILSFNPDFVFGSWGGTFSQESGVTPETLLVAGVQSYTLTESCITADVQIEPTLENTYTDILNIGRIFGAEDRAQVIVDDMRAAIEEVQSVIGEVDMPVRSTMGAGMMHLSQPDGMGHLLC